MAKTSRATKRFFKDSSTTSMTKQKDDLLKLAHLYKVVNPQDINEFLQSRPHLIGALEEIPQKASHYFPKNKGVTLKLEVDPEEGYEELVIRILIDLDPEEALSALDRFDEEWWLDRHESRDMDICVNIGYV